MKTSAKKSKLPTFVNVNELRKTPKDPVILYFTKAQWKAIISRKRILKRSSVPLNEFQLRYQLAPWGNGDVMIYPNPSFRWRLECKPTLEVYPQPNGTIRIRIGFKCRIRHCAVYTEAYPGKIPEGANGIGCDDSDCPYGCREIFVGTQEEGFLTCKCG